MGKESWAGPVTYSRNNYSLLHTGRVEWYIRRSGSDRLQTPEEESKSNLAGCEVRGESVTKMVSKLPVGVAVGVGMPLQRAMTGGRNETVP